MLAPTSGIGLAAFLFLGGCEFWGWDVDLAPPLPAPKAITTDFTDTAIATGGTNRRILVQASAGGVFSIVFEPNSVSFPNNLVSLPGVEIERLHFATVTPGTIDLVVKTSTGIIFLEGQPDGTFAGPPRTIFTGQLDAVDANSLAFRDVDNDGDTDIVAAGIRSDTVPPNSTEARLLINDGSGNFANADTEQLPTDAGVVKSVSAGDVNNDGKAEFTISGGTTRLLTVNNGSFQYFSTSTGQGQPGPTAPIEGPNGDSVLADLNNDGRSDYIATSAPSGIGVRLAQPAGGLGPLQPYSGGLLARLIAGDFNADGHVDVAAHSPSTGGLWIYNGDGSGVLAPAKVIDGPRIAYRLGYAPALSGSAFPASFYTVDPVYNTIQAYTTGADGPVSTDSRFFIRDGEPVSTRDAAVADVNGDGYPDLIASESNVAELNFTLNAADGTGQFLPNNHDRVAFVRIAPMRPVSGQGDARAAVAVAVVGSNTAAVVRLNSTANPTEWDAFSIFSLPEHGSDVSTGDVDGDGRDDAVFSHAGGNRALTVVTQQPGGTFAVGPSFFASGGAWSRLALGDLNGDNIPDAIVSDSASGAVRTLLNDGVGNFAPAPSGTLSFPPPLSGNIAFMDVDGDGNRDLVIGAGPSAPGNGSVRIARGDGQGGFLDSSAIPSPAPVESVAAGDINGDGNDDIAFAVASGSPFVDGSLGCILGTPDGLSQSVSYHYIAGDPKAVFLVDLKNAASSSRRTGAALPSVLVAAYSGAQPYQGISVLEPFVLTSCPADLNADTFVDDADFVLFLNAYNVLDCADPSTPPGCPADFNSDTLVDDADFVLFIPAYNALVCP